MGTLTRILLSRLQRISAHGQTVAEILAVLGGTGDLHLINQLTGLTPVVVADTVRALTETGLVAVEGSTVRLAHELCRLQLSRGITHTALLATNAQAAQAMARDDAPAAQVARYLLASPVVAEDWAAVSLKQAADDAVRDGNLTAAANYLTRLNAEPLPAALRADALLSLAEIEARTSGQPANDHIAAALAMPLDDANRRRALAALADVRYLTGADDQAPSVDGPDALVAELYLQHAVTAGEGVRLLERAGEHVGTISGQAARQLSSLAQCAAQSGQGPERAKTWGERALASAGTGLEDTVARLRAIEVLVETEEVDTARQAAEAEAGPRAGPCSGRRSHHRASRHRRAGAGPPRSTAVPAARRASGSRSRVPRPRCRVGSDPAAIEHRSPASSAAARPGASRRPEALPPPVSSV